MAFNNWPWTSLQNLNLDWILNKVKEALTKSEEAKTTANGIAGTANSALTTANNAINLANGAIELAEQAREIAEEAGRPELPAVDSNDYGKLLGVDLEGEWNISEYPQQVVGISENTNDVSITLRTVGGAFPQTVNVAKSDASRYYIDFTVDSDDISQISSVTSNRTYTEISNAYASGKHVIIRIKYNTLTLFESDTMRLFNPSGSVQAFQFLLALSVNNGVGKYTYAFVNSNDAVNVLETTLPSGGGSGDGVYVINAEYVAQNRGFSFDKTTAQIVTAINAGMLPVVLSLDNEISDNVIAKMFVLGNYSYDGEDSYFSFYRATGTQIEELRKAGSESYAYIHTFNYLPASAAADSGKFLRVNAQGIPAWETVPAAENASFGGV